MIEQIKEDVRRAANQEKAVFLQRFFRTGPGQYAEGDKFVGLTVQQTRKLVERYKELPLGQVVQLLDSPIHEERLLALLILVNQFQKAVKNKNKTLQEQIFDLYLKNTRFVNNWDLVDSSAAQIVGGYLDSKGTKILDDLARSENLWERRIAIIATFAFLKKNEPRITLRIAKSLLHDKHDLIHKAVGWALREMGKVDKDILKDFLTTHGATMPRTMLRYSIEHFSGQERQHFLKLKKKTSLNI